MHRIRNFLRFWKQAMVTGGRLAQALGGLATFVLGGSVVAYLQLAHHKATFVLIGAAAVILIVMAAAYLQWEPLDRELAVLKVHPVSDQHAGQLRDTLQGFRQAVGKSESCPELEPLVKEVFTAHFPLVGREAASWSQALALPGAARSDLYDRLNREVGQRSSLDQAPYDPEGIVRSTMYRLGKVAEQGEVSHLPPLRVNPYPPDSVIYDDLAYAMGLDKTFTVAELDEVVSPVEALWNDALTWHELRQYESAVRSVAIVRESFDDMLEREEIREAYPVATNCPICGIGQG